MCGFKSHLGQFTRGFPRPAAASSPTAHPRRNFRAPLLERNPHQRHRVRPGVGRRGPRGGRGQVVLGRLFRRLRGQAAGRRQLRGAGQKAVRHLGLHRPVLEGQTPRRTQEPGQAARQGQRPGDGLHPGPQIRRPGRRNPAIRRRLGLRPPRPPRPGGRHVGRVPAGRVAPPGGPVRLHPRVQGPLPGPARPGQRPGRRTPRRPPRRPGGRRVRRPGPRAFFGPRPVLPVRRGHRAVRPGGVQTPGREPLPAGWVGPRAALGQGVPGARHAGRQARGEPARRPGRPPPRERPPVRRPARHRRPDPGHAGRPPDVLRVRLVPHLAGRVRVALPERPGAEGAAAGGGPLHERAGHPQARPQPLPGRPAGRIRPPPGEPRHPAGGSAAGTFTPSSAASRSSTRPAAAATSWW